VPVPRQDKLGEGFVEDKKPLKWWMMEVGALIVQMSWHPDGLLVYLPFVIFPCTIKSTRWRAIMEEVYKGCSEFCGYCDQDCRHTDRLKALAVNLSQPSG